MDTSANVPLGGQEILQKLEKIRRNTFLPLSLRTSVYIVRKSNEFLHRTAAGKRCPASFFFAGIQKTGEPYSPQSYLIARYECSLTIW
jgi:hypothetical protein